MITPTGRADEVLGGSCTYFAAAASFFSPVRIVAAVGEDFPEEHRRVLAERSPVEVMTRLLALMRKTSSNEEFLASLPGFEED